MADKCKYCNTNVKSTDQQVNCPNCGSLYHYSCWKYFTEKCESCGFENEDYKQAKIKAEEKKQEEHKLQQQYQNATKSAGANSNNVLNYEETGMFANIGEKLKSWAKKCFILGIVSGVIIAIGLFVMDEDLFFVGVGAGIMEIAGAWAFSLILYAFGELVSNSKESKKIQQEILNELRKNK